MEVHDMVWALKHLLNGKAVSRDAKSWAGKKVFLVRERHVTVDKKHPYHPHCKGDTIVRDHLMITHHGIARPFVPSNDEYFAGDWRLL